MSAQQLIDTLAERAGAIPPDVEILAVRQPALDEMMRRAKRLLAAVGEMSQVAFNRADWVQRDGATLGRLAMGARLVIYHGSGAMRFVSGLAPMEHLLAETDRGYLMKAVERAAERLRLAEWVGSRESLHFERLWQIKAAGADREGRATAPPVVCRVIGAYRHVVGGLPVLGAASVALKLAGGNLLDSLVVQVRETSGERIDWAPVVRPEEAARDIVGQLAALMGRTQRPFTELARAEGMQFGYLSLGKRSAQRVLAPHYVATIAIEGRATQAYQLIAPATARTYLPLSQAGQQPPIAMAQRSLPVAEGYRVSEPVAIREPKAPAYA